MGAFRGIFEISARFFLRPHKDFIFGVYNWINILNIYVGNHFKARIYTEIYHFLFVQSLFISHFFLILFEYIYISRDFGNAE